MRHLVRAAAVLLVGTAAGVAGLGSVAPSAQAAGCGTASGVTVVVDHKGLGGGVQEVCDPAGGGRSAASLFTGNGFSLTYVQRQPGFVCRVDGVPASDPCVNTPPSTAYWGLFWSDGTSGSWSFSSVGVQSLTVPDGGYVAFAWQGGSGTSPPGVAATAHASATPTVTPSAAPSSPTRAPSPSHPATHPPSSHPSSGPSSHPTSRPTSRLTTGPTTGLPSALGTPTAAAVTPGTSSSAATNAATPAATKATRNPTAGASSAASGDDASSPEAAGTTTSPTPTTDPTGAVVQTSSRAHTVPTWLVLAVLGALLLLAGGIGVARQRRTSSGIGG